MDSQIRDKLADAANEIDDATRELTLAQASPTAERVKQRARRAREHLESALKTMKACGVPVPDYTIFGG